MNRRQLIELVGVSLVIVPLPTVAQAPLLARIGVLSELPPTNPPTASGRQIFSEVLQQNGWIEGRNLVFIDRVVEGHRERYPVFANELIALNPNVIVTIGSETTATVRDRTSTIPIVMIGPGDPVGAGFVASLARPGGNITGVSSQLNDINAKKLQIVKELRPNASRVAIFWCPDNASERLAKPNLEAAAQGFGLTIEAIPVTADAELETALSALSKAPPDALMVSAQPPATLHGEEIAAFAIEHGVLTVAPYPRMVQAGLLMSFGPHGEEMTRRAAEITVKILNGTKPADIPVEQPTTFDMVLNLKTAKALGLTVPAALLARVDEVIE